METPHIKFEHSPADSLADSFVSTPGTQYPSLFDCMDSNEATTPQSYNGDSMFGDSMDGSVAGTPAPEKKSVKKRKSWGQQLPEPKTNLPPRKRAKTDDEKEQRRVERVLRNRRAAQSSRERKRQEVEALEAEKRAIERRNQDLEIQLRNAENQNLLLQQELARLRGGDMKVFHGNSVASSPSQTEQFRQTPTPVTFSQELFGSRDSLEGSSSISQQPNIDLQPSVRTVNPASLSPEIRPVIESSNASSSLTQHSAVVLCDLQCQLEATRPWMDSTSIAISQIMAIILCLTWQATSTLLNPLSQIVSCLRTGSSLSPTTSILTTIIWLVTTTASLSNSTSTTSSTTMRTTSPRPMYSLRIRLLNRLLACSPNLARPLMDATMGQMRLQSEQQLSTDCLTGKGMRDRHVCETNLPSLEALMTLLWAIHVFEKERGQTPRLDIESSIEIRQTCRELDVRQLEMEGMEDISFVSAAGGGTTGQKPLENWRTAFKHEN